MMVAHHQEKRNPVKGKTKKDQTQHSSQNKWRERVTTT